jgi:hypothetical protein
MRKMFKLFLCGLFILGAAGINAQEEEVSTGGGGGFLGFSLDNLNYGAKIGLVSSTFASQGQKLGARTESRTGLAIGVFGEYKILDYLGATVEVLYVQEGTMRLDPRYVYPYPSYSAQGDGEISLTKENSNILLHNLEIPVMVNYYLPEMGDLKFKAFAGVSFDFILRATAKNLLSVQFEAEEDLEGLSTGSIVLPKRAKDDVTSSFEYYNVGAIIGAGVTYDMFTLDVSFKWGLRPINNLATFNIGNGGREDFTTNTLMIKFGANLNKLLF